MSYIYTHGEDWLVEEQRRSAWAALRLGLSLQGMLGQF